MKVAFDSNFLTFVLSRDAQAPVDPATGEPVTHPRLRVTTLIEQLQKNRSKIIIPTPVLSEVLVYLEDEGTKLIKFLDRSASFEIAPFDVKASIDLAQMNRLLKKDYDREENTWAKVKFDRQILAICKSHEVDIVFSDDKHVCILADKLGFKSKRIFDLPLPEDDPQGDLLNVEIS